MAGQLDLFGQRPARRTTPRLPPSNFSDTSRAAAVAHTHVAVEQGERVYAELVRRGRHGATNEELAVALGMRVSSVCGRVGTLKADGRVVDSGQRRAGLSGLKHKVWVVMECTHGE
jgi:hypothetical protein